MSRIKDKIKDIRGFIAELEGILPEDIEDYEADKTIRAACERYVEKIVEGLTDIAFMLIKLKKFRMPEDDIDAFRILLEHKVISEELYKKLKEAKGMRNIIAHEYGKIDNSVVHEAVKRQLGKDTQTFLKTIEKIV